MESFKQYWVWVTIIAVECDFGGSYKESIAFVLMNIVW